jgi:hypothetical protein
VNTRFRNVKAWDGTVDGAGAFFAQQGTDYAYWDEYIGTIGQVKPVTQYLPYDENQTVDGRLTSSIDRTTFSDGPPMVLFQVPNMTNTIGNTGGDVECQLQLTVRTHAVIEIKRDFGLVPNPFGGFRPDSNLPYAQVEITEGNTFRPYKRGGFVQSSGTGFQSTWGF